MYLSPAHSAAVKLMLLNIFFMDLIHHTVYSAKNAKLKLISSIKAKKKQSMHGTAVPERRVSMRLCDLDEIKICVDRQYKNCHGYSGNKKAIYREAILAVKSILHAAKPIDAVPVVRCLECKHCDPENYHCDHPMGTVAPLRRKPDDFCSYGERKEGAD